MSDRYIDMDEFLCSVCNSWDDNLVSEACAACREVRQDYADCDTTGGVSA